LGDVGLRVTFARPKLRNMVKPSSLVGMDARGKIRELIRGFLLSSGFHFH